MDIEVLNIVFCAEHVPLFSCIVVDDTGLQFLCRGARFCCAVEVEEHLGVGGNGYYSVVGSLRSEVVAVIDIAGYRALIYQFETVAVVADIEFHALGGVGHDSVEIFGSEN